MQGYLGRLGWANLDVVQQFRDERAPTSWSLWFFVPDALLRPVWVACLVVLALFTVGLFSRVTAVLAWVIAVSTAIRSPISVYGFDDIIITWAFYLAVTGASGQAVSLDRYIARFRRNRAEVARRRQDGRWTAPSGVPAPSTSANIALRLIQCHLVVIYAISGLSKFQGAAWWTGTATWGTLAAGEFRLFDLTWLAAYPSLINAMTHGALLLETLYPVMIWVRPVRPVWIAAVLIMHAGHRPDARALRVQPGDGGGQPRLRRPAPGSGASSRGWTSRAAGSCTTAPARSAAPRWPSSPPATPTTSSTPST